MIHRFEDPDWDELGLDRLAQRVASIYINRAIEAGVRPTYLEHGLEHEVLSQAAEELGIDLEEMCCFSSIDFLDEVNEELMFFSSIVQRRR